MLPTINNFDSNSGGLISEKQCFKEKKKNGNIPWFIAKAITKTYDFSALGSLCLSALAKIIVPYFDTVTLLEWYLMLPITTQESAKLG